MSLAVKASDHAGQLVRDIMMKGTDLGIVQKTGEKDLQTLADRTANDCIVGSLKKVHDAPFPLLYVFQALNSQMNV